MLLFRGLRGHPMVDGEAEIEVFVSNELFAATLGRCYSAGLVSCASRPSDGRWSMVDGRWSMVDGRW